MFHLFTETLSFYFNFISAIDLFLMSTTMNSSDMDNYSMQHEEFTKNNWLRQYDASIMMRPFYFNDFNQEKSDKFYDDSYNYFLKQFEGFSEIELKLLVIAALIVTALLVFVFISTVTMTIGSFPFFCVVFNKNRNTEKEAC